MKNHVLFQFLILLIVTVGCSKKDEFYLIGSIEKVNFDNLPLSDTLFSTEVNELSDTLFLPTRILTVGDYLIIVESVSDNTMHIYNLAEEKYIGLFGKRGAGPGETFSLWRFHVKNAKEFLALDTELAKVVFYNIDTLIYKNTHSDEFLNKGLSYTNGIVLNVNELTHLSTASSPIEDQARFYTLDLKNPNPSSKFGSLPRLNKDYPNVKPFDQKNTLEFAHLAQEKNLVFLAYAYIPLIEIYDLNNKTNQAIRISDKLPSEEFFIAAKYFTSPSIEGDKMYALYWEGDTTYKRTTDIIMVFDRNGKPIKKLILEESISMMVIQGDYIYGLIIDSDKSENKVLKFKINQTKSKT
ncbi:TolB-like 6-bladed beta-propeller domain-containing protein [Belliella sp. R4-6]|uniref:TolB-like 6-bladed beta-propeller domain-containing protein n=1 Tax=Belliella alkalica TaxID=1730871 RepID=A0ABS9V8H1_9BACT|nr:BF3164 family lipoprotein [Belliella alkalica]MCH7412709.1 TolB-like 6-bladed beta-propeller domain-containing protein [Belliella alkalica]